jgi:hypothetical protein
LEKDFKGFGEGDFGGFWEGILGHPLFKEGRL